VKPLNSTAIESGIGPELRALLSSIELLDETDSTNQFLLRLPSRERHGRVVLAERQSAGKGRRGRRWQSPGGNVWMSVGWHFGESPASLSALGLVVGVCACRALARFGLNGHGIKWPNDILLSGAKLGGILVELSSRNESNCDAVIGIGVNVHLGKADGAPIEQPWTDLSSALDDGEVDRNRLVGVILEELLVGLDLGTAGFEAFLAENWSSWDLLAQQAVRVDRGNALVEGTARGIAKDGSLRVSLPTEGGGMEAGETVEFRSGEVSIRRA